MDCELSEKNIVITGRFIQGNAQLKEHFARLGANVQTSVNAKTDILIIGRQPSIKQLDKFDSIRGAGYDIALWEQNDVDSAWCKYYQDHMTQEEIQEEKEKIERELMLPTTDETPEEETKRFTWWQEVLIEFVIIFFVLLLIWAALMLSSWIPFILAFVVVFVADYYGLLPNTMSEEACLSGSLLGLFFVGLLFPTSRHRQYRGWQFGRMRSR